MKRHFAFGSRIEIKQITTLQLFLVMHAAAIRIFRKECVEFVLSSNNYSIRDFFYMKELVERGIDDDGFSAFSWVK